MPRKSRPRTPSEVLKPMVQDIRKQSGEAVATSAAVVAGAAMALFKVGLIDRWEAVAWMTAAERTAGLVRVGHRGPDFVTYPIVHDVRGIPADCPEVKPGPYAFLEGALSHAEDLNHRGVCGGKKHRAIFDRHVPVSNRNPRGPAHLQLV